MTWRTCLWQNKHKFENPSSFLSPFLLLTVQMLLNVVLERLHSEFMIQHVCEGKALRNKLGDSDSQRKTSGLDLNKVQNYLRWRRCHLQRDQNLDSKLNLLIKWRKEIFSFPKYLNTIHTNSQKTFCPAHRKRAKAVKISLVSLVRVQPLTAPDVIKSTPKY